MKAFIVFFVILAAVAGADYYYNANKAKTAEMKTEVVDTVGSKMSAAKEVVDESVEAVETYHSEHPL
jgi:hypothetical protein